MGADEKHESGLIYSTCTCRRIFALMDSQNNHGHLKCEGLADIVNGSQGHVEIN